MNQREMDIINQIRDIQRDIRGYRRIGNAQLVIKLLIAREKYQADLHIIRLQGKLESAMIYAEAINQ